MPQTPPPVPQGPVVQILMLPDGKTVVNSNLQNLVEIIGLIELGKMELVRLDAERKSAPAVLVAQGPLGK